MEGRCLGQEDLNDREQRCVGDGHEDPVVDPQNLGFRVFGQELAQQQTGDGEHEAQFDADTDQDQEAGAGWNSPERMAAEMLDQGVDDLEKPVHEIEAQPGGDAFEVALTVFVGVNIDHQRQQGDNDPLKIFPGAQDGKGLLGEFGLVHGSSSGV